MDESIYFILKLLRLLKLDNVLHQQKKVKNCSHKIKKKNFLKCYLLPNIYSKGL